MSWRLFLDDLRFPWIVYPYDGEGWIIARSYEEALDAVKTYGFPEMISFDHDLGESSPTGYDLVKTLTRMDMDGEIQIPPNFGYKVHSANPVGANNIRGYLDGYLACMIPDRSLNMRFEVSDEQRRGR